MRNQSRLVARSSSVRWFPGTLTGTLRIPLLLTVVMMLFAASSAKDLSADEVSPGPQEHFVPADQLDAVFERDSRGVMMKRGDFLELLRTARANAARLNVPVPIALEQATVRVSPSEQQAVVQMEIAIRQYVPGWQVVALRLGHLNLEQAEINGRPALIGRDPEQIGTVFVGHEDRGESTLMLTLSTPLASMGSDRSAAFELPDVPVIRMNVTCPSERRLTVNELKLDRPGEINVETTYTFPAGGFRDVRLRWVSQQNDAEAQSLVFVRTDAVVQVQQQSLKWNSNSRVSVFGGSINRIVAHVPATMEITNVESSGLESWTLADAPEMPERTQVTLTYRQPFSEDRLIHIQGVATELPAESQPVDGDARIQTARQLIPSVQFAGMTTHQGRLVITHDEGLRLLSKPGRGIRRIAATDSGLPADAVVYDFWNQEFELEVTAAVRDRELFAESDGILSITDSLVTFQSGLTIETLHAPLFEMTLGIPAGWELLSIESGAGAESGVVPQGITWTPGSDPTEIRIRPVRPVAPGQLLSLNMTLNRSTGDPDVEQSLELPVVTLADTTTTGGTYRIRFSDDLVVTPLRLQGLTPLGGQESELVYQNPGVTVSGMLSIIRKPARLAARSVLRTWTDSRHLTFDGEITVDVLHGTVRTLLIRLSESLGPDVRFHIVTTGAVPGTDLVRPVQQVTITEQIAGDPADGLRPFTLKLDQRFAGSITLQAFAQQPRPKNGKIAAPVVQLQDAVRQHGVLVFEAAPDQELNVPGEIRSIPGLFAADAGIVEPPSAASGRRVAMMFRFVRPEYAFEVSELRYASSAVPSAVCDCLDNICVLADTGNIQRWSRAHMRSSGVQTLRFSLPGDDGNSFLWSVMFNDEPVEVRSDNGQYLLAVPAGADAQEYSVTILYETNQAETSRFGSTVQEPVRISIDAADHDGVLIDVLKQTWRVYYPQESLLVDSDGEFRPVEGIDQPGWLASLTTFHMPDFSRLARIAGPLAFFFLCLFVLTVIIIRRRWKTLAGLLGAAILILVVLSLQTGFPAGRATFHSVGGLPSTQSERRQPELWDFSGPDTAFESAGMVSKGAVVLGGDGGWAEAEQVETDSLQAASGIAPSRPKRVSGPVPSQPGNVFDANQAPADAMAVTIEKSLSESGSSQVALSDTEPDTNEVQFGRQAGPAGSTPMLRPRAKGTARLSVRVPLEIPESFRSRDFVTVADAVRKPSELKVTVRRVGQITAVRCITMLMVLLAGWRIRKTSVAGQMTLSLSVMLISLGLLPVLPNAWQIVADGAFLGALFHAGIVIVTSCFRGCSCPLVWLKSLCRIRWSSAVNTSTAVLLPICLSALTPSVIVAQLPDGNPVLRPTVVVPYAPDEPALRSDQVFLKHDDFLKLYRLAHPQELSSPAPPGPPLQSAVVAAFLRTTSLTAVEGTRYAMSLDGRFVVWSAADTLVNVPLPLGPCGIRSAVVDGVDGTVIPLMPRGGDTTGSGLRDSVSGVANAPDLHQMMRNRLAPESDEGPAFAVQVSGRGFHVVDVKLDIAAVVDGALGSADLPLRSPPAGTLEWALPSDGLDAVINGRSDVFRRSGLMISAPIAGSSTLRLQWFPGIRKVADDVVFHAGTSSALSLDDSGRTLRVTSAITLRQGEISEFEMTLPDEYSVQSVTGSDLAGWAVRTTDTARVLHLQLLRSITDTTRITVQLFATAPAADALQSLEIPILSVRGATRDSGVVTLKTGSQFQVRSDALSAVTQINPSDATAPDGDELPGRAMLAWRYTRHPANVRVRVTSAPDELTAETIHAVRLEEQRQLWSSRIALQITGAPRSRIDIRIPNDFLLLRVDATGLRDWYLTDEADVGEAVEAASTDSPAVPDLPEPAAESDGASTSSGHRILSLQLADARSGTILVVLQGQRDRDSDRSLLTLMPPVVRYSGSTASQLAVWLDAASESAGFESGVGNGSDWNVRPPGTLQAAFREVAQTAPSLAFVSSAAEPGDLQIRLRRAISTLIGETVTVTNVTETAMELTLALNWTVKRAAADTFGVELPSPLAAALLFDLPGKRRILLDDLGNGRTRITFQLQQPVSDRLFVVGTASLPIPSDRRIRADVPDIVVPADAPSTLSGQQHFWVIVNQSGGLLQPAANQPEDRVSPDQMTTQIPSQLLQQAVAVVRLRPGTAAWSLMYPDQHQVSPAVITLATHTTVLSDDGSWRSRHQLDVTNQSRQFVPVILPERSRLLYCLVQGRPSRVVMDTGGDQTRYLIPVPQSGLMAGSISVEFALAGILNDAAAEIRSDWQRRRLLIPAPTFPEFRDDEKYGISISRNRWSVYVPQSWRAVVADDPAITNVVRADDRELADASLLSEVERAINLMKQSGDSTSGYLRKKLQEEILLRRENLMRTSGNEEDVEQQRGAVLQQLERFSLNFAQESIGLPAGEAGLSESPAGNYFLYEKEQLYNSTARGNALGLMQDNGRFRQDELNRRDKSGITVFDEARDPEQGFRFSLPESEDVKSESKASEEGKLRLRDNRAPADTDRRAGAPKPEGGASKESRKSPAAPAESVPQSRLMQRRQASDLPAANDPFDESEMRPQIADMPDVAVPPTGAEINGIPQEGTASGQEGQQTGGPAVSTGMLSLMFDIPTDGYRLDFLRVGGNPALALDVRSEKVVGQGLGLGWLSVCLISVCYILGPGRRGQWLVFIKRVSVILLTGGLIGSTGVFGNVQGAAVVLAVLAAVTLSVVVCIRSLQGHR